MFAGETARIPQPKVIAKADGPPCPPNGIGKAGQKALKEIVQDDTCVLQKVFVDAKLYALMMGSIGGHEKVILQTELVQLPGLAAR